MGYWKEQMIAAEERGWSSIDKAVCADCVGDEDLKDAVTAEATAIPCSYCGKSPAAPVDVLMEAIDEGVRSEWQDAADAGLYWDGREGGYQGAEVIDSYDLFHDIADGFANEDLRADIVDAYSGQGTQWVRREFWRIPDDEVLANAWDTFATMVKHESRFVFLLDPNAQKEYGDDHIPAGRFLQELGTLVAELGLIKVLPAYAPFYRARLHDPAKPLELPTGLAAPMRQHARFANRMSPAGIPMFYGASDIKTCVAELQYDPARPTSCTAGTFKTARPFNVLDLTQIPPVPGLYSPAGEPKDQRARLLFLHAFRRQISQPIKKDELAHIEYVPTQVITEYFRRAFRATDGSSVSGILYPSSRGDSGVCCVLFFENEQTCLVTSGWEAELCDDVFGKGPPKWWLKLDPASVVTFTP